jgi:hypothetical protein
MKIKIIVFISILLGLVNVSFAQKKVVEQDQLWYSLISTFDLSEKWFFQNEFHERHFVDPIAQNHLIMRSHLHRRLGKSGWDASFGGVFFVLNPNTPGSDKLASVPELRPHVEFGYKQKLEYFNFDHRYLAEARFWHNTNAARTELADGFEFANYRFRYRIQATVPIIKMADKRSLKFKISNEILVNLGSNININVFDQNRASAALNYDILNNLSVEVGYLNWFQEIPNGSFLNRDVLRFAIFHNISFLD